MEKELDKSALLSQLKIDHDEPEKPGVTTVQLITACLMSAFIGAGILYFFAPSQPNPNDQDAASNHAIASKSVESKQENVSTVASNPIELPNADEVLNASGYITPRRITTVSAEVMGLITEVLVEEGMTVKKGQVLAEIDKSTAKVNVDLAEAQLEASNIRLDSLSADIGRPLILLPIGRESLVEFLQKIHGYILAFFVRMVLDPTHSHNDAIHLSKWPQRLQ